MTDLDSVLRIAGDVELPVPVARRIGLEIDEGRASRKCAVVPGHRPPF